jgi:proteasome alpha subunit
MFTPYDWQEGIGNRAQYIEGKLAQGSPVLAVSLAEGILVFTFRRQARKIYEIYDRLLFAGIGQQSDVEAIRVSALEFASREGYNRSEEDVTIQRVATAMSEPLKRAFANFGSSPLVARSLFAEVNETPEEDLYYALDYDGDYGMFRNRAVIAGTQQVADSAKEKLAATDLSSGSVDDRIAVLRDIWLSIMNPEGHTPLDELTQGLTAEAVLLDRSKERENRFRLFTKEEF